MESRCGAVDRLDDELAGRQLQGELMKENQAFIPASIDAYHSLVDVIRSHAETKSSSLALAWLRKDCHVEKSFTYGQLWHISGVLGTTLRNVHGLQKGDRAMIVYPFGIDFMVAFLACMRIGVVVVSVYPPNPKKLAIDIPKFAAFVEDSGACIALTTSSYSSTVVGLSKLIYSWPKGLKWITTDSYPSKIPKTPETFDCDVPCDASALCFLQYTSGSTGDPKGVMISHGNLSHQCQILVGIDRFDPWKMVSWCPQYHDMGLFMFLSTLWIGGRVHGLSPLHFLEDPCMWPRAIEKYKAEVSAGPDFSLALCCKRMEAQGLVFNCSSLQWVILGAEPTQLGTVVRAARAWRVRPGVFKNSYGLAEHCVMASTRGTRVDALLVSAGRLSLAAALGVDIRIAAPGPDSSDPRLLEPQPEGVQGEICLSSPSVALGYWRKPEATAAAFSNRVRGLDGRLYLRTGDMGYVRDDNVFVTSRLKDVVIINGRNYAPSDMEKAVEAAFPQALRPGCAVALQGEQAAVLLCEVRAGVHGKGAAVSVDSLAEDVRAAAERACGVPVQRVLLLPKGSVPKTTSGKVQRSRAREKLEAGAFEAVSEAERGVVTGFEGLESLRELLEASGVTEFEASVADNGLSSIQLMQVVSAAKNRFQVDLPYESLTSMTASELCSAFSAAEAPGQEGWRSVRMPAEVAPGSRVVPSLWWRAVVQVVVLSAQLAAIALAAMPAVALFEGSLEPASRWWVLNGRPGPLVGSGVVLWMVSYTALCVAAKWVLVGRLREGRLRLWGAAFVAWLVVERLWGVWEWAVGRFLLSTPWLNIVYKLLGSDVALSARIDAFYRCWDLVSIQARAKVQGRVYARVLDSGGVHLGRVSVGEGAAVEGQSVVQAWSTVGDGVVVESGSLVPPSTELAPAGSRWHGVPCRMKEEEEEEGGRGGEGEEEEGWGGEGREEPDIAGIDLEEQSRTDGRRGGDGLAGGAGEPAFATRVLLPLFLLCAITAASAAANALLPESRFPAEAWSVAFAGAVCSLLGLFACTGGLLFAASVALKWSFASGYLTDALAAVAAGSFLPWLDKTLLVGWWHVAFGMRVGAAAKIMLTAACAPSTAHLCAVGDRAMLFNAVMAPRARRSLGGWLRGRCGAPWTEGADVTIGDGVGLYVLSRVEGGVRMGAGSQAGALTRVVAGQRVEPGKLLVGNPALEMQGGGTGEGAVVLSWGQTALCLALMGGHVAWVAALVVVEVMVMVSMPGEVLGSVYLATAMRVVAGVCMLLLGLGLEVVLFKRGVFGRAEAGELGFATYRAVLFHHLGYITKRQEELFDAFFAGTLAVEGYFWLLGMDIDVGRVLLNSAFLSAQDAELIAIREAAVVDEVGILSGHNVTLGRIVTGHVHLAAGATMHPFSALFIGSVGDGAAILPRSKPIREAHLPPSSLWAGTPAVECTRCDLPAPESPLCPRSDSQVEILSANVNPGLRRGSGLAGGGRPGGTRAADETGTRESSIHFSRPELVLNNVSAESSRHDVRDEPASSERGAVADAFASTAPQGVTPRREGAAVADSAGSFRVERAEVGFSVQPIALS